MAVPAYEPISGGKRCRFLALPLVIFQQVTQVYRPFGRELTKKLGGHAVDSHTLLGSLLCPGLSSYSSQRGVVINLIRGRRRDSSVSRPAASAAATTGGAVATVAAEAAAVATAAAAAVAVVDTAAVIVAVAVVAGGGGCGGGSGACTIVIDAVTIVAGCATTGCRSAGFGASISSVTSCT